jgi:DNA-binding LacI/PurR family transcriptional regulator
MGELVNQAMRQALAAVTASIREIAEEAGVSRITLARHATGSMGVSPEVAHRVAAALRRRGKRLHVLADRLERALAKEEE